MVLVGLQLDDTEVYTNKSDETTDFKMVFLEHSLLWKVNSKEIFKENFYSVLFDSKNLWIGSILTNNKIYLRGKCSLVLGFRDLRKKALWKYWLTVVKTLHYIMYI